MINTMSIGAIRPTVRARLPTAEGQFQLIHYSNDLDDKEHLALVMGDLHHGDQVLVRVHSECFTGDVLGSQRCDCGEQLHRAMQLIAAEGRGVVIYLRQEGRGIGLQKKLQAYNLQDQGHDTVDANLLLGHQADERTYWAAAAILHDLGLRSLRLLTNNPHKIDQLRAYGLEITARVPMEPTVHAENAGYLRAKVQRMRHLLQLPLNGASALEYGRALPPAAIDMVRAVQHQAAEFSARRGLPFVTLSYAQSIDGSIASAAGEALPISGESSLTLTHLLRAAHDAILVGVGAVLADDPRLTVRLVHGANPQPVILDSHLRTAPDARCVGGPRPAWVATTARDGVRQQALEAAGARLLHIAADPQGRVDLLALLKALAANGVRSVMVEGGARVLTSFLQSGLANGAVVTIAPLFIGGLRATPDLLPNANTITAFPRLSNPRMLQLGDDMILYGQLPHRINGIYDEPSNHGKAHQSGLYGAL